MDISSPFDSLFLLAFTCKKWFWWFCPSVFTKHEWLICLNAASLPVNVAVIFWPSVAFIFPKVQSANILAWAANGHAIISKAVNRNIAKWTPMLNFTYRNRNRSVVCVLPMWQSKFWRRKWKTISNIKILTIITRSRDGIPNWLEALSVSSH